MALNLGKGAQKKSPKGRSTPNLNLKPGNGELNQSNRHFKLGITIHGKTAKKILRFLNRSPTIWKFGQSAFNCQFLGKKINGLEPGMPT